MTDRRKIFFQLARDESGYPPVATESLWAIPTGICSEYILDNIPFFQNVATIGDTVSVEELDGRLWYRATVRRTDRSLIRVVGLGGSAPVAVGKELEALGCAWELGATHHLISVDVPPASFDAAHAVVVKRAASGAIDYEEAILR